MAKTQTAPKERRRTRAEIDRNYFFADVLIKTGVAVGFAIAAVALYTPFTVKEALQWHMYDYLAIMGGFGLIGMAAFFAGQHLRSVATHWDFD